MEKNSWKKAYGAILGKVFRLYNIDEPKFIRDYVGTVDSSFRHYKNGRNFPSSVNHEKICFGLEKVITNLSDSYLDKEILYFLESTINSLKLNISPYSQNEKIAKYIVSQLKIFYSNGKQVKNMDKPNLIMNNQAISKVQNCSKNTNETGKIQAVFFDFDGTLTKPGLPLATWEYIWLCLGYNLEVARNLHRMFDKREINYVTRCKLIEEKFKEKKLNINILSDVIEKIDIIDGCKETFIDLRNRNIKIYIVSGSILFIIQRVLKDLYQYVDEVKANDFKFSPDGFLTDIIATKYDFSGKPNFINKIALKMKISTGDILFVGNSYNDKYVHRSGARTLLINPKNTDPSNFRIWNDCIQDCNNLMQILDFLEYPI